MTEDIKIRKAGPYDHETIICALQDWWGGRDLTAMLPKLFLNHFHDTSFVAENNSRMITRSALQKSLSGEVASYSV